MNQIRSFLNNLRNKMRSLSDEDRGAPMVEYVVIVIVICVVCIGVYQIFGGNVNKAMQNAGQEVALDRLRPTN